MIANKIKPKIQKVIDKFPTYVDIYRDAKNEFEEPNGKDLVCSVKGFYHEGNTQISAITTDKGQVKRSKQMFLMVIYDEDTVKIKENDYDIIYFEHLQMYKYFNSFDRKNVKFVLDQQNSESEIVYRTYQNSNNFLKKIFLNIEYNKIRKFEKKALSDVDKIYALSENDVESMKRLNVNLRNFSVIPIGVIDNGIINKKEDKNKKLTLMFIGTLTWNPNNHGILWFVRNVIPKLNESGIEYDLYIVGKNPSEELKELCESYNNIFVTGYVDDVDEMYVKSDVMVVPLFVGSGQRVKIIESFSKGIPVISTSIGAEGLDCITDYNVVIADTDIEFVDSLRKMSDETFRKKIASNARKTFEEKYSLEAYISAFNDSFKTMILKK